MGYHLHHVHLFASDIDATLRFYREWFAGEVVLDMELAGARNVFLRIGAGRIHFYDRAPTLRGRATIHHFGIQTDDIDGAVCRMSAGGVPFTKGVTDAGFWKYIMVPAPDDVLIELFQVDREAIPPEFLGYFEWGDDAPQGSAAAGGAGAEAVARPRGGAGRVAATERETGRTR